MFMLRQGQSLSRRLARQNAGFKRHQFVFNKAMHKLLEHAVFFGQFKVHGPVLSMMPVRSRAV